MFSRFFRLRWSDHARYIVFAAIGIAAVIVVAQRRDTRALAGNIGITSYANGVAIVQVPYRSDVGAGTMTVLVNGQMIAREIPAFAMKYGNDNVVFRPSSELGEHALVRISFDAGGTVQTLLKNVEVTYARPDTSVAADTSAPDTATEAVIAMAKRHNADEGLPAYPQTITDELKHEMRWTASDGVTPEQYVSGVNLWAKKKELPIRTEKVAGATMLDTFARALEVGGTVQSYIQFRRAGTIVGGRMVGLERVVRSGEEYAIAIRDSAGPTGTTLYRVRRGELVGYGFSDDVAVIGWGFVQHWTK